MKRKSKFDIRPFNFETGKGRIWFQNPKGIWVDLPPKEFLRYIAVNFGKDLSRHQGVPSECERILTDIQDNNVVNAVASLAGHFGPKVIYTGGMAILIKDAPKLIVPREGEYPTIMALLLGMLDSEQYDHHLWWLSQAVDDLYNQRCTLGTANGWCGPHSAGKSLWLSLITLILGGRVAFPYQFMSGQTIFNAHTFGAEHLIIDDEHSAADLKSRLALGTAIKSIIANESKQAHAKYQMPFMVPPVFQRLNLALNDDSKNIALLPPGDPSLDHKVSLYQVQCVPMPMPTSNSVEKEIFMAKLISELPAFVFDLIHHISIPMEIRDNRFGLKVFRHSSILIELEEHQHETKLLHLMDRLYFGEGKASFIEMYSGEQKRGTPTEIECDLRHKESDVKSLADDLLRGPAFTGRYLRELARTHPDRVSYHPLKYRREYWINAPAGQPDADEVRR